MALVVHGGHNLTFDADIAFSTDGVNVDRLVEALAQVNARMKRGGAPVDAQMIRAAPFLHLDSDVGLLDLVPNPPGMPFDQLHERALKLTVGGEEVFVASLKDIKLMKIAAGRPQDLFHLAEIMTIEQAQREDAE
jgi:hypothetical protein